MSKSNYATIGELESILTNRDAGLTVSLDRKEGMLYIDLERPGTLSRDICIMSNMGEKDDRASVRTVIFGYNINAIDTFFFLPNLKEIIFEGNVSSIREYAFSGHPKLKYVRFEQLCNPTLGRGAFLNCRALKRIDPPGGYSISDYAFQNTPLVSEQRRHALAGSLRIPHTVSP